MNRYEIEIGFWTPLAVMIAICALLVYGGYKLGEKRTYQPVFDDGYMTGQRHTEKEVIAQGDGPYPLRVQDAEFRCVRIKR